MEWIFVGALLGSVVTSSHTSRELCEGRAVLLKERGVVGECHSPKALSLTYQGNVGIGTTYCGTIEKPCPR